MDDGLVSLAQALNLGRSELVAFIGGGGKTSLMMALSKELGEQVVLTATTRLSVSQAQQIPEVIRIGSAISAETKNRQRVPSYSAEIDGLLRQVSESLKRSGRCLVIGQQQDDKLLGVAEDLPGQLFASDDVDYVLVEADGSRRLPCKAPGPHEPVIPPESTIVIPSVGMDCLGKPLSETVHRPELVSAITGLGADQYMTEQALARLITHPLGGLKGIPRQSRVVPYLNKVDSEELQDSARRIARQILKEERIERVVLGAIRLNQPVRAIHRRVTAVVLAAGQSSRMGRHKLLLPWGETTVLGQTIANLLKTSVNDVIVVSGHDAQEVDGIARQYGAKSITNANYESGEMISSVQTALGSLPGNCEAILVVLADQPMVESKSINRIVDTWAVSRSDLVAPVYGDRRGNPVIFGRRYFEELLSLPAGTAPRDILARHDADLHLVPVETDSILHDIDREEDYERWRPITGRD